MFVPFRGYFSARKPQDVAARAAGSVGRRLNRRRPTLESLETRNLLSRIGPEQQVSLNPQTTDNFSSDNASSSIGTSVAVWVNSFSSTDHDIWAQRFNQIGSREGAPIQVDFTIANSFAPHVSMDSTGNFVVVWENFNSDGTVSIMMRYFNSSGSPITGITPVSNPGSTDFNPDVAASDGSFVISWTHQLSATNSDIEAERFVISSGILGQGIFDVNPDTNVENNSSVAMSPDGRFDIAYQRQFFGNDWDILASQYNGSGSFLRSVAVNFDSIDEEFPSVSMDNFGNAVIAYQAFDADGIYANRLSSSGVVGSRITVQDHASASESNPSVALRRDGHGEFVVAYDTRPRNGSTISGVHVTEMSASDRELETHPLSTSMFDPAVSINGSDHYLVTYTRFNSSSGHEDIFSVHDFLS